MMVGKWRWTAPDTVIGPVSEFVASSIEHAHEIGPTKWGVTPYDPTTFRMNMGFCEVLTVDSYGVRILAVDNVLPHSRLTHADVQRRRASFYKPVPGSVMVSIQFPVRRSVLQRHLVAVREAHFAAITFAASSGVGAGVRAGHRDGAVAEFSRLVGRRLPLPTWTRTRPEFSSGGSANEDLHEGAMRRSMTTRYERNKRARAACLALRGYRCSVCGMSFEDVYGAMGRDFIEVHHLERIADVGGKRTVDPERDLRPVCANCHRMLHTRVPAYTIEELRRRLR